MHRYIVRAAAGQHHAPVAADVCAAQRTIRGHAVADEMARRSRGEALNEFRQIAGHALGQFPQNQVAGVVVHDES